MWRLQINSSLGAKRSALTSHQLQKSNKISINSQLDTNHSCYRLVGWRKSMTLSSSTPSAIQATYRRSIRRLKVKPATSLTVTSTQESTRTQRFRSTSMRPWSKSIRNCKTKSKFILNWMFIDVRKDFNMTSHAKALSFFRDELSARSDNKNKHHSHDRK